MMNAITPETLVVWWLSGQDLKDIRQIQRLFLPDWLQDELRSAYGRSGRGRLWVSSTLGRDVEALFRDDDPLSCACRDRTGIVIPYSLVSILARFPGLITTLNLERLDSVLAR